MADNKLESFKIGDTRRPTVASPKKPADRGTSESTSLGFKRIEGILESEDPDVISGKLQQLAEALESLEKSGDNKQKAVAKKAIVAVERTADLMEYLFQTKASLQSGGK